MRIFHEPTVATVATVATAPLQWAQARQRGGKLAWAGPASPARNTLKHRGKRTIQTIHQKKKT